VTNGDLYRYTQVRSVKNFTELGFAVVSAPPDVHARLKERLHKAMDSGAAHKEMGGKPQGIFGDNYPDFVQHGERDLLKELQPLHEEWAPAAGPHRQATAPGSTPDTDTLINEAPTRSLPLCLF
jgi:hypothetical protein